MCQCQLFFISRYSLRGMERQLTLVIVILIGVVAVQLAEDLHHISVGVGAAEGVARAIEAEDELRLGLC